jgi:hypothetical protein
VIFEGEGNRGHVVESLVGPFEFVFHQPFGQAAVEDGGVRGHVAEGQKLILDGAVKAFVDGIVLGRPRPRPVVVQIQAVTCCIEVPVELAAIVSLNIFNLSVKQDMEALEEITGRGRTVGGIHPGKGHLGVPVNGSENEPFLTRDVADDGIEAQQEAGHGPALQLRNLLPGLAAASLSVDSGLVLRGDNTIRRL